VSEVSARDLAFAAMGLLRCPDRLPDLLDLLPASKRQRIADALEGLSGVDRANVMQMLIDRAQAEHTAFRSKITADARPQLLLAPRIVQRLFELYRLP